MRRAPLLLLLALALLIVPPAPPASPASVGAATGTGGAVASADPLATEVGLRVLRDGGNAVDSAVATALALAVVYPEAGNLGGGGFAVVRMERTGMSAEVTSLDFRETAPAAARRDLYLDPRGQPIPDASLVGPLSTGVPGSPAGLHELHQKLGRLPWRRVVEPAVRLAREGFPVDRHLHELLGSKEIQRVLEPFPETVRVWLPGGEPPPVGSTLRLPELAATLEGYAARGPEAVLGGRVAEAVEAASRRHGGILTAADLAGYRPEWRDPVVFRAYGWTLASMDLPSSGGILLGEVLGLLERLGWEKHPRSGADRAHLLAEAFRRAYADRFALGDPSTTRATAGDLLAGAWLDRRAREILTRKATPSKKVRPFPGDARAWASPARGKASDETTHLSTVDAQGNVVALTTTLNGLFGSGLYVPEAGFFLNNEMDDFATAPGRPNLFGLVQGEANAVAPGKRMLSSMAPTIAWKGREVLALGGRGGSRIPTSTIQVLLNAMVDGDDLQAAIGRPRLHHQWLPDKLTVEPETLTAQARAALERRGHRVEVMSPSFMAKIHAIRVLPDGRMQAAADPRSTGNGAVVREGVASTAPTLPRPALTP
jgi:gamma-glutamyltranspeptidase / glutathione hydrolase